jgi:hypothetical protein
VVSISVICSCGESCLLVSWCAGDTCGMAGSDEDYGRNMRPAIEDRGWSSTGQVLSGRTIERSGDIVCSLYHAQGDEERWFHSSASTPRSMVCQWLGLKTTGTVCQWFGLKTTGMVCQWFGLKTIGMVSPGLASKPMATVSSGLASKPVAAVSPGLASKLVATVSPSLASKPVVLSFPVCASEPTAMV